MTKYVRVCRCSNEIEAGSVISLLKSNNFNPRDLQPSPNVEIAGVELDFYVEVPENEALQAISVLRDLDVSGIISNDRS